jgi:SAM-dependent methyltransferase
MAMTFFQRWFPAEANNQDGYWEAVGAVLPGRGKVLDLGCGDHHSLARFRTPAREVWGTDFQIHPELAHAEWFRPLRADGTIPFPDATFNVVTAEMVLEHVAAPDRFLGEVARVLRPGGCFVGHSISGRHYVTWVRRLLGLCPHAWTQHLVKRLYGRAHHDTFPTFYRLNTEAQLARAARRRGLEIIELRRYACPGYFMFSPWLYRGAVIADWVLARVHPELGRIYFTATLRKGVNAVRVQLPLAG